MKPVKVEVGQAWSYKGMQGRPLFVLKIEKRPGCSTNHPPEELVEWAIFRKNKAQPVHDLLENDKWVCVTGEINFSPFRFTTLFQDKT